jgi:hypothetical protein
MEVLRSDPDLRFELAIARPEPAVLHGDCVLGAPLGYVDKAGSTSSVAPGLRTRVGFATKPALSLAVLSFTADTPVSRPLIRAAGRIELLERC